jgi:type IV pilus assembly protein PilM
MSLFPVPKYLAMPAVGLDISDDAVRFIELRKKKKHLEVVRFASRNFPLGVIHEGHVRDKKKLQETIASFAVDYGLTFANVALPEEQAYLVNIRIPKVAPSEIRGAIELQLEENVPISGSEAVLDYVVIGDPRKAREHIDVVVSVLPHTVVNDYLEVFEGTGITPREFEFESQAMARAVVRAGDEGTFLIADIGKMVTEIFVVARGVVQFSASLDIGGFYFTQAIERSMKLTTDEAESLKIKHGIIKNEESKDVYDAMSPVIQDLHMRFMRHYSYWQTHHGDKIGGNIEHVFLAGGGSNLKGLPEYIASQLDVAVSLANPWINVASFNEYVPPLSQRESLGYVAAIGLALRNK